MEKQLISDFVCCSRDRAECGESWRLQAGRCASTPTPNVSSFRHPQPASISRQQPKPPRVSAYLSAFVHTHAFATETLDPAAGV